MDLSKQWLYVFHRADEVRSAWARCKDTGEGAAKLLHKSACANNEHSACIGWQHIQRPLKVAQRQGAWWMWCTLRIGYNIDNFCHAADKVVGSVGCRIEILPRPARLIHVQNRAMIIIQPPDFYAHNALS
jgi:hypothetical protein